MNPRLRMLATGCLLGLNIFAHAAQGELFIAENNIENRWSVLASLGYSEFQHAYHDSNRAVIGRMALGAELLATTQSNFGLEMGLQNGYQMSLKPRSDLSPAHYAIQTSVTPMLDLLMTANASLLAESLFYTQIKGGIAYRHWQTSNDWINNRQDIAGEIQAGLGYPLTELTNLNFLYQGIFGINSRLRPNTLLMSNFITNIPTQHGLMLGLSVIV